MSPENCHISVYTPFDHPELLQLLMELHSTYFNENISPEILEIHGEHDLKNSYNDYINILDKDKNANWYTLLAKDQDGKSIGFIIGSIASDDALLLNKIGKFEDWYVREIYRKSGIGKRLYLELEKWFKENGCKQVLSETWFGNDLSVKAHENLGFFISGIRFSKRL